MVVHRELTTAMSLVNKGIIMNIVRWRSAQQISLQQVLFNNSVEHKGLIGCAKPKFCIHPLKKNTGHFQI